jgi:hypothetical protein
VSDAEIMRPLKSCQTLKSLLIQFESLWPGDKILADKCWIALEGFRNLTSLELYNFHGTESHLIKEITGVLVNSPNLKTLGLGLLCDCDAGMLLEVTILEGECKFLENLCLRFQSQKASPLKLHTLKLGTGMCLSEPRSVENVDFLAKLVDISGLKCLHLFNDLVKYDIDDDSWPLYINWGLLVECTGLYQLSISMLDHGLIDWLNDSGKSVRELIITHHYGMYDRDLNLLEKLNLPELTTLFVRERYVGISTVQEDWSDTDTWVTELSDEDLVESESESESSFSVPIDAGSTSHPLADSDSLGPNAVDPESFARPAIVTEKLHPSTITVLDRLYDGGSKLKRLSLCLDLETQFVSFGRRIVYLQ